MACPAVLAGGPEASQNGLGLVIPAKLTFKSAIGYLSLLAWRSPYCSEPRVQAARGCHSLGNRVHDFAAAVGAIATGEILGMAGLMAFVYLHRAILVQFETLDGTQRISDGLLADRAHDHINLQCELRAGDRRRSSPALGIGCAQFGANAFKARDAAVCANHADRLRLPQKRNGVLLGKLIFVGEGGHFGFA